MVQVCLFFQRCAVEMALDSYHQRSFGIHPLRSIVRILGYPCDSSCVDCLLLGSISFLSRTRFGTCVLWRSMERAVSRVWSRRCIHRRSYALRKDTWPSFCIPSHNHIGRESTSFGQRIPLSVQLRPVFQSATPGSLDVWSLVESTPFYPVLQDPFVKFV